MERGSQERLLLWMLYRAEGRGASVDQLKLNVDRLCQMILQRVTGEVPYEQRGTGFKNLNRVRWSVNAQAVALVLAGAIPEQSAKREFDNSDEREMWLLFRPEADRIEADALSLVASVKRLGEIVREDFCNVPAHELSEITWTITCEAVALVLTGVL